MSLFYMDTSAVLKRYHTEKGTDVVDHLYENRRRPDLTGHIRGERSDVLVTSHFTCLEVESVAARMKRGRRLDDKGYQELLGAFAYDLQNNMSILAVGTPMIVEATGVAAHFTLRPGDSIHLASALNAQERSRDVTIFVTSDKELIQATMITKMRWLDPEGDDAMELLRSYMSI